MFCSQCGKEVPPESRFCPHCGAQRDDADIRPGTNEADEALAADYNEVTPEVLAPMDVEPPEPTMEVEAEEVLIDDLNPPPPDEDSTTDSAQSLPESQPRDPATSGFSRRPPSFAYPDTDKSDEGNGASRQTDVPRDNASDPPNTTVPAEEAEVIVIPAESAVTRQAAHGQYANGPRRDLNSVDAIFASSTGGSRRTAAGGSARETASSKETTGGAAPPPKRRGAAYHLLWIMPLSCLLLVLLAAGGLYVYHEQTHREVRELLTEGEELALAGQLPEGLERIEQALVKRPEHPVLVEHQTLLQDAISLEEDIAGAKGQIEQEQHEEAAATIAEVKQQLERRSGPIYEQLQTSVHELESASVLANTKAEFASRTTVSELIPLLNRLRAYESEDAEALKEEIRQKVVELVQKRVNALTATKDYPSALSAVDEALSVAPDHDKLTELRASIVEEQENYVADEAERIREALEAAQQEQQGQQDSQQNPVEVLEMKVQLDANGRFHIKGILKNISSRTLPSLLLHYEIYDQSDQLLEKHTMRPSPLTLEPGAEGEFEAFHEDGDKMYRAIIKRVEWGV